MTSSDRLVCFQLRSFPLKYKRSLAHFSHMDLRNWWIPGSRSNRLPVLPGQRGFALWIGDYHMALVRFYRDKNGKPGFKVRPGFCLNANYDGRKSLFSV
jgi:hypothetical protein